MRGKKENPPSTADHAECNATKRSSVTRAPPWAYTAHRPHERTSLSNATTRAPPRASIPAPAQPSTAQCESVIVAAAPTTKKPAPVVGARTRQCERVALPLEASASAAPPPDASTQRAREQSRASTVTAWANAARATPTEVARSSSTSTPTRRKPLALRAMRRALPRQTLPSSVTSDCALPREVAPRTVMTLCEVKIQ